MTRRLHRAVLGLILVPAMQLLAAQAQPRPGQYEVTLEMKLPVPKDATKAVLDAAGFDKNTRREFITAEELKGPNGLVSYLTREAEAENCKVSNVKSLGNKTTFTTTCEADGIRMTSNTEVTYGAD